MAEVTGVLDLILRAFLSLRPVGTLRTGPFEQRIEKVSSFLEPDLMVILKDNPGQLTETAMIGPADLMIEVVSPESLACNYGEKYLEYETVGVREYGIIDPQRREARFCLRGAAGEYACVTLPGLKLDVSLLWCESSPTFYEIGDRLKAMLDA